MFDVFDASHPRNNTCDHRMRQAKANRDFRQVRFQVAQIALKLSNSFRDLPFAIASKVGARKSLFLNTLSSRMDPVKAPSSKGTRARAPTPFFAATGNN